MKTTEENNRLIAEFMGWEYDEISDRYTTPFVVLVDENAFGDDAYSSVLELDEMKFDCDWNWLMKAVEEIAGCKYAGGVCYDVHKHLLVADIEETYKAVVEFIEWYNKKENK